MYTHAFFQDLATRLGLRPADQTDQTSDLYGNGRILSEPLVTWVVACPPDRWTDLGLPDQTSVVDHLIRFGSRLRCGWSSPLFVAACRSQMDLGIIKLLVEAHAAAGDFDTIGIAMTAAVERQNPLLPETLNVFLVPGVDPSERDYNGWDLLAHLASAERPVDMETVKRLLQAGCRTDLDGCECVEDEHRLYFDQILKEYAAWEESRDRVAAENAQTDPTYGPDWDR